MTTLYIITLIFYISYNIMLYFIFKNIPSYNRDKINLAIRENRVATAHLEDMSHGKPKPGTKQSSRAGFYWYKVDGKVYRFTNYYPNDLPPTEITVYYHRNNPGKRIEGGTHPLKLVLAYLGIFLSLGILFIGLVIREMMTM